MKKRTKIQPTKNKQPKPKPNKQTKTISNLCNKNNQPINTINYYVYDQILSTKHPFSKTRKKIIHSRTFMKSTTIASNITENKSSINFSRL